MTSSSPSVCLVRENWGPLPAIIEYGKRCLFSFLSRLPRMPRILVGSYSVLLDF
ncbi:hypothetical protein DPMN_141089 [Dreissena polymorpha]|uniref:Uncharacterized protein n=1 Tax=Dreissena polymorpha TaxID=45954 RepID=A0A9D4G9B2_DREPO|nr:hypothetical protein DPMN_141089 [Dreissena polymorpha]